MNQDEMKVVVGRKAAESLVVDGMKIGLGTGSTAIHVVKCVGDMLREGRLTNIRAVPTSYQSTIACEESGVPIYTLNSREIGGRLDLTIDGADEVDAYHNCVKGGGGALLLEKIVAYASNSYAIVIDESKVAANLGMKFPVAIEVIPEARVSVTLALKKLHVEVLLRDAVRAAGPVVTECGNILLDIRFRTPVNPPALERELNQIPGVVENGFFTMLRPKLFIGHSDGTVEICD